MAIPTNITDLNTNEALNSPAGFDNVGGTLDNFLRAHAAIIRRQFSKGDNLISASILPIPPDGSYMIVTKGSAAIETFSDNFDGRTVALKFDAGIMLINSSSLILPGDSNITTKADDVGIFVNEGAGVWRCLAYPNAPTYQYTSKFLGEIFSIRTDLGATLPPRNDAAYRYIVLTASDPYNDGALDDESVTGSDPDVLATAVISFPASPFINKTVNLINTERRTLKAGSSGALEDDQNAAHTHTGSATSAGAHTHTGTAASAGAHTHTGTAANAGAHTHTTTGAGGHTHGISGAAVAADAGGNAWPVVYLGSGTARTSSSGGTTGAGDHTHTANSAGAHTHSVTTVSAGAHTHSVTTTGAGDHTHSVSINSSGGDEVRVRNQGITYLMRIF